jgi:hypothetical protein
MGNFKSKKIPEPPELPKPLIKKEPCQIPNCGQPELLHGYCDFHQHRHSANSYRKKNGLMSSK